MTQILLDDKDALLFVEFQKHHKHFEEFDEYYELFMTLKRSGVFGVKNGKAILNFNSYGELADVELQYHTFKLK